VRVADNGLPIAPASVTSVSIGVKRVGNQSVSSA
jgi:hypothetical protein